jgi:microcystin-dependent protein
MSADTFDPFLGLLLQATGNNNNSWGTDLNASVISYAARAIAGNVTHAVTGGTLDLSGSPPPAGVTQALDHIQIISGTLTSDQTIIMPNLSKTWQIINSTTGAFNLYVKTTSGTATQIPQGTTKQVICDGNNGMIRADKELIGSFRISGKATAGAGELACDGSSKLRTAFPDVFAAIGTTWGSVDGTHFTLPLLTDTNRYLRAAGGAVAVGAYQANQNLAHTHTGASFSGTTATQSVDHTHTGSGTTSTISVDHTHSYTQPLSAIQQTGGGAFPGDYGTQSASTGTVSANHTHTYSFTSSNQSASHTHTFSGTTSTIPSSGGTEARPESAAALICIVY